MQAFPKIALVSPARDYETSQKMLISKTSVNLIARIMSMGKLHHTFTATGLLSLGSCAAVPGSIPNQVLSPTNETNNTKYSINIGHRAGVTNVRGQNTFENGKWKALTTEVSTSSRLLMSGEIPFNIEAKL
jgi:2-methylaconitate cis-trans-isomerase PrpF